MNYLILLLLFTLTTYIEGKSLDIMIDVKSCQKMWDCKCAGNAEAGPGYVTCSGTDPAAALPNNKKIEVICYVDIR